MKPLQLLVLPLLALVVAWVFSAEPWQVKTNFTKLDRELAVDKKAPSMRKAKGELDDLLGQNKDLTKEEADTQWQRSLFNVDRKEETIKEITTKKDTGQIDIGNYELELIGAGRYGKKSYASITIKEKHSRVSTFRSSRSSTSRTRTPSKTPTTKRRDGQSNIVMKGDKVGETGYTLTEIHFVPRSKKQEEGSTYVVLTKGAERIELYLDKGGKSSELRKAKLDKPVKEVKPEVEKKTPKIDPSKLTPPPPPPPPPVATGLPLPKGSKVKNGKKNGTNVLDSKMLKELRKRREINKRK